MILRNVGSYKSGRASDHRRRHFLLLNKVCVIVSQVRCAMKVMKNEDAELCLSQLSYQSEKPHLRQQPMDCARATIACKILSVQGIKRHSSGPQIGTVLC
jgi:hypothetical protein